MYWAAHKSIKSPNSKPWTIGPLQNYLQYFPPFVSWISVYGSIFCTVISQWNQILVSKCLKPFSCQDNKSSCGCLAFSDFPVKLSIFLPKLSTHIRPSIYYIITESNVISPLQTRQPQSINIY